MADQKGVQGIPLGHFSISRLVFVVLFTIFVRVFLEKLA